MVSHDSLFVYRHHRAVAFRKNIENSPIRLLEMPPATCRITCAQPTCTKSFKYRGRYLRHLKTKHGIIAPADDETATCPKCGSAYTCSSLRAHLHREHPPNATPPQLVIPSA